MLPHRVAARGVVLAVVVADLMAMVVDRRLHLTAATTTMPGVVLAYCRQLLV
jgi:hypothetical protein